MDQRPTVKIIIAATAIFYGETAEALLGIARHQPLAHRRQVAMTLSRRLNKGSWNAIGRAFGRDHTTCMQGNARVTAREQNDPALAAEIAAITALARKLAGIEPGIGEHPLLARRLRVAAIIGVFARRLHCEPSSMRAPVLILTAPRDEGAMRAAWLRQIETERRNRNFREFEGVNHVID